MNTSDDFVLDEYRYASNLINMLSYNIDFFMESVHFDKFTSDFYITARELQKQVQKLALVYSSNLKFSDTVFK